MVILDEFDLRLVKILAFSYKKMANEGFFFFLIITESIF